MNLLGNLKIKTKFLGNIIIVLSLCASALGMYQFALSETGDGYTHVLSEEVYISMQVQQAEIAMLEARRAEKDFMLRKDMKYPPRVEKKVSEIITAMGSISETGLKSGLTVIRQLAETIINDAQKYQDTFKAITESYVVKGLSPKEGLQGEFRKAAHMIMDRVPAFAVDNLYMHWLQMRRYEKDFIRTKSPKYRDRFLAELKAYEKDVSESGCMEQAKNIQLAELKVYGRAMKRIMQGVPADLQSSLYLKARTSAGKMEKALKSVFVPRVEASVLAVRRAEKDYLLRGSDKYVKKTLAGLEKLSTAFSESAVPAGNRAEIEKCIDIYRASFRSLVDENQKIAKQNSEMRAAVHAIEPELVKIHDLAEERMGQRTVTLNAEAGLFSKTAMGIGGAALFLGIIVSLLVTNSIVRPLCTAENTVKKMADGDLNHDVESTNQDETGVMLNAMGDMIYRLRDVVGGVNSAVSNIASGSEELASTSESMSQGTSEQAASVEELSASINSVTTSIEKNVRNSEETARIANNASSKAGESGEVVAGAVGAMKDIAEKITIIEDIARQTNLLALNAAIEAARAGEHGKGFAVVAAEVRKLAERSGVAAGEISELSTNTLNVADRAVKMLNELVPEIGKTSELVGEINATCAEQGEAIKQIGSAVSQVEVATQSSASAAEEVSATSQELAGQAESLRRMMGYFKCDSSVQSFAEPKALASAEELDGMDRF
ncbi:methyl-accepting chemotaxis protein [Desulfovibrio sp. JC022]|uniref:methyl-accepting chemotaxis protein n=1 Tax=Desulfovibrio sp. JC022 TaxID=2593642 RepID=UPI0013D2143B|nr:methyl-accepting chemotaxis protein [Desulfovibrio sp. JC022]